MASKPAAAAPPGPNSIRIVHFADLHLDRKFAWADRAAASKRRAAIRSSLQNIVELALAEGAHAITCGGDLYEDERFTPDTERFVADVFDCGIPVLIAPGNHDPLTRSSLYERVSWSSNVHVFRTPQLSRFELLDGFNIWGGAHLSETGTAGFLQSFGRADGDGVHVALFHGSETHGLASQGSNKLPHAPFDRSQISAAGMHYALVGHYHRAVLGDRHCYPGNPDPLEFGEDGDRGPVVLEFSSAGHVSAHHRSVATSQVRDLTVDVSSAATGTEVFDLARQAMADCEGFVRLDLVGDLGIDVEYDRSLLVELGADFDGFVLRDAAVRRAYDLGAIRAEEASVRARFVELVESSSDLSDEDRALVIEMGLRAFEQRRDLEVV